METEKRGSKWVFFHLFEWNSKSKSRKKLFPSKFDIHEDSKPGNSCADSLIELDDENTGTGLNYRPGNESNKDLSVSSDEGYGSRAPGVVARLMGLDCMPSATACEPPSSFLDSSTISYPPHSKTSHEFIGDHHQIREYNIMSNEFEAFRRNPGKSRAQKAHGQPLERFQTEILPPKSAKSIPITHHKLLSPIKSPGFIPKKSAAYIMEAAAKFIDSSPQENVKGNRPSFGSSSVPLRIRDLKEKMEAAQKLPRPGKPKEPNAVRNTSSKNKEKPVSLALQAKANVQRREGLKSSSNRGSTNRKDLAEVNSNCVSKSHLVMDKRAQKTTERKKTSSVLRQNNQKQNSIPSKDRLTTRTPGSCEQAKKYVHANASSQLRKTVNTVVVSSESGSKKVGSLRTDTESDHSSSKANSFSRKKRLASRDIHSDESVEDDRLGYRDKRYVQCNIATDGSINQEVDHRKKNMDIVSFTFSSPIKGSMPTPLSSNEVKEQNNHLVNSSDGKVSKLSPPGFSTVTGDALSVLLEHKLRELTCKVENSNLVQAGSASSASILQDQISPFDVVSTIPGGLQNGLQLSSQRKKSDGLFDDAHEWQDFEMEEQCSSSYTKAEREPPITDSFVEPSLLSGSCHSSESENTDCNTGSKHFSLTQSEEAIDHISTGNSRSPEGGKGCPELSDSALPSWDLDNSNTITTFNVVDKEAPTDWELEYVSSVVHTADLSCKDFGLGQTCRILKPSIFDQMEIQTHGTYPSEAAECSRLDRKVWFDCVSECLDLRFQQFPDGGCTSPAKWMTSTQRKGRLAEELYKEILVWRSSGELMVDEVVDKDMSSGYGKWLNFETEAFEESLDIEGGILSCLVDEIVDFFLS